MVNKESGTILMEQWCLIQQKMKTSFVTEGDDGEVRLNRIRNNAISPTGIFHCELPVSDNVTQTLYVGVYATNDNGEMFCS